MQEKTIKYFSYITFNTWQKNYQQLIQSSLFDDDPHPPPGPTTI